MEPPHHFVFQLLSFLEQLDVEVVELIINPCWVFLSSPLQTEIHTSVSTLDVVNRFQRQVHPNPNPKPNSKIPGPGSQNAVRGGEHSLDIKSQAAPTTSQGQHTKVTRGTQASSMLTVAALGQNTVPQIKNICALLVSPSTMETIN